MFQVQTKKQTVYRSLLIYYKWTGTSLFLNKLMLLLIYRSLKYPILYFVIHPSIRISSLIQSKYLAIIVAEHSDTTNSSLNMLTIT